jgi:hypothetical protein
MSGGPSRIGAWVGGALIGAIAVGLAAAALFLTPQPGPKLNPETLCAIDAPPPTWTLIVVDASDKFSPRHKKKLVAAVASEVAQLADGGRLSVLALDDRDPREPVSLFSRCAPKAAGHANALFENPQAIAAARAKEFETPLAEALEKAETSRREQASPLTDALASAVGDLEFRAAPVRRLVIVSDMMEHRPGQFSLYAAGATYKSFRESAPGVRAPPDLSGVSVRVILLDRDGRDGAQAAGRENFWTPWFADAQPADVRWEL